MEEPLGDMKYEQARLTTFRSWPANAKVEAWKMAKAGMLYTGQLEEVTCTFCGCIISDWQYGDQVMSKHRQASPSCPFIQNESDNVPLLTMSSITGGAIPRTRSDAAQVDVVDGAGSHEEDTDDVGIRASSLDTMRSINESDFAGNNLEEIGDVAPVSTAGSSSSSNTSTNAEQDTAILRMMKSEGRRLATFTNWSKPYIRPADLAKAGFFYLNQRDNCRCAFCGNFVGDWEEGDIPLNEHKKLFPMCSFVRGLPVGNIPIVETVQSTPESQELISSGQDVTGIRENYQRMPASAPENQMPAEGNANLQEELGIISHHGPMHPSYATPEARIRSFKEWPPGLKVQPKDLVDAGFYYIGLSDQVKCFYCDGGLRNWHSDDDPWVEHARWFTKCAFVRLKKGEEFIKSCIESKPPEEPHEISAAGNLNREVTEDDLRVAMSEALVRQVLSMGIDPSRVKMAIKKQLESYGYGFNNPEHLINAAFSVQRRQEQRVTHEHNNPSGAMLAGLGARAHRSFDEVTSRRWEEEMYMSTEDEDENPPTTAPFRSLPGGVQLVTSGNSSNTNISTTQPSTSTASSSSSTNITSEEAITTNNEEVNISDDTLETSTTTLTPAPAAQQEIEEQKEDMEISEAEKDPNPVKESPKSAAESLELENARLKEARTCKVCMDAEVGVVFLPCGHLICCVNCAPSLKDCAVCRTKIQGTVRTFMS